MNHTYLLAEVTWTDIAQTAIAFLTLAVTIFIAYMANRWAMEYWHKQKKAEINYQLENLRYQNMFEAAKAAWGLLSFLTEKENGNNQLNYKGTKEKPEVYFSLDRGRQYLSELSRVFYEQGNGVFLTPEINNEIFHVRTNVYKLLDKEQRSGNTTGEILLTNEGLVTFFRESYERLRITIKTYLKEKLKYEIAE